MRKTKVLTGCWALVSTAVVITAACASRTEVRQSTNATQASPTLAPSIFYEEGRIVFLGVNTGLSRFNTDDELVAVEIGIANKDLATLTVDLEGITLHEEGKRWPAVSLRERAGHRLRADFERRMQPVSFEEVLQLRYPGFRRLAPNVGGGSGDRSLARTVGMARHTWLLTQVWFPHPGGDLSGRVFEVWLSAPELPDPVFTTVRF